MNAQLQDQLLRLLDGTPRGMTVERLRTLLQSGGAQAHKHEIVDALRGLSRRDLVQIGPARKWFVRRSGNSSTDGAQLLPGSPIEEWLHAIPCSATLGERAPPDALIPDGRLVPDLDLLKRLLPYYQEALRAGDGGSPFGVLARHGEGFAFLQPDAPWWPTETQGRILRVPLSRLASIQDYLERADALPFVADDLFINFDDDRSTAGLEVLWQLSRQTQVLFFTHHQHLVQIARGALGESVHVVMLADLQASSATG